MISELITASAFLALFFLILAIVEQDPESEFIYSAISAVSSAFFFICVISI